jgi:hypothetical protein
MSIVTTAVLKILTVNLYSRMILQADTTLMDKNSKKIQSLNPLDQ